MRILAFYNSQRMNESLTNLTKNVVAFEDEIDELRTWDSIMPKFELMYKQGLIRRMPVEMKTKPDAIYRIKLADGMGNESYIEIKRDNWE